MTIREALTNFDSEVLLAHVLKKNRAYLFANLDKSITNAQSSEYTKLIRKRRRHWPVAYLTGHKEFFGFDFKINKNVLIPRPETELLVELGLKTLQNSNHRTPTTVVDLGTGSGSVIVSIAKHIKNPKIKMFAIDISPTALQVARANARNYNVRDKIEFIKSNLFGSWKLGVENFLILANLPYLTLSQIRLNPELKYEPIDALRAGKDGLKYFREFFRQFTKLANHRFDGISNENTQLVRNETTLLLEHDPTQVSKIKKMTKKYFPKAKLKFHKDLSNRYRVVEIFVD